MQESRSFNFRFIDDIPNIENIFFIQLEFLIQKF